MHQNPLTAVSARKEDEEKMTLKKMLIVSLLVLCALAGRSENITVGDFSYSYNLSSKEATLTAYNGSSSHVDIPSSFTVAETYKDDDGETHARHHTITVTGIGNSVFANKTFITSVSFHNKIKAIDSFAFQGCTGLTSVRTPSSLVYLGSYALYGCERLLEAEINGESLDMSNSMTVFSGCTSLRRVSFGDGVISLPVGNGYAGGGVFGGCGSLQSVSVGRGVSEVPSGFLAGCGGDGGLSVSFGGLLRGIGGSAFSNANITNIEMTLRNCSVGSYAFSGCPGVNEMDIDFTQIVSIGSDGFSRCGNIRGAVDLPLVTSIGSWAFSGCKGITSVRTPASLTSLGSSAFSYCTSLVEAEINGTNVSLGSYLFQECVNLKRAVFGDGIIGFASGAWRENSITFPYCTNLQSVVIGCGVQSVPSYFLKGCGNALDKLTVSFGGVIDRVDGSAFANANITNIEMTLKDCSVGSYAFSGCPGVNEMDIDFTQIVSIGSDGFSRCGNIRGAVDLPLVTSIGSWAFQGCTELAGGKFGDKLTAIGSSAFSGCTNAFAFAFVGAPPSVGSYAFNNVKSDAVGTYTAAHAAEWEAVIDDKGYWNRLKMKPSYYTVIYDANNGTGETFSQTVEWGEPQQAADGAFTWEGHYFMGWAFAPDGEVACVADDTLTEPTDDNVVTLYAQWATVTPEFADWSVGSITLSAMGFTGNSLEDISISYCNANIGGIVWLTPEDGEITKAWSADGKTLLVTDNKFSRRLDGVCPIKYRIVDKFGHAVDSPSTRSRHGIIVGLGKYDPGFKAVCEQNGIVVNELSQLRNEAELAFDILVNCGGGVNSEKPLVDSSARLVDISNAWKDLAQNKVAPGDVVFFVISTHGARSGKVVAYDGYYTREAFQNDLEPFRAGKLSSVKVVAILMNCHSEKMTSEEGDIAEEYGSVCTPNIIYVTEAASEETGKTMKEYSQFGEFFFNQGLKNRQADAQTSLQGLDVDGTFGDRDGKRDGRIDLLECTKYAKEFAIGRSDHDVTNVQYDPSKASIMADTILVADSAPVDAVVPLAAPAECKVSKDSNGLIVRWSNVEGATHYIVNWVRAGENYDSHWAFLLENKWDTESAITFKTADMADAKYRQNYVPLGNDTEYLFWVVAVNGAGKSLARLSDIERTFVAKKDVTYTVDFFAPGAKSQPAPIYVSAGCQIGSLPTPERVGREFLGWISVEDNSELTPFTVITADARYRAHWSDLEYTITLDWLRGHPAAFSISGGDVSAASVLTAANGCRTVGECYELGIDPEDPNDDLKIAGFKMKDGKPEITLNHTKDGSGNSFEDRVKILGKAELTDAEWQEVPPEGNPAHRFFKVGVEMP